MEYYRCANHFFGYCADPSNIEITRLTSEDKMVTYVAGSTCPKLFSQCPFYLTLALQLQQSHAIT